MTISLFLYYRFKTWVERPFLKTAFALSGFDERTLFVQTSQTLHDTRFYIDSESLTCQVNVLYCNMENITKNCLGCGWVSQFVLRHCLLVGEATDSEETLDKHFPERVGLLRQTTESVLGGFWFCRCGVGTTYSFLIRSRCCNSLLEPLLCPGKLRLNQPLVLPAAHRGSATPSRFIKNLSWHPPCQENSSFSTVGKIGVNLHG